MTSVRRRTAVITGQSMIAKTAAERQEALRARRAIDGMAEVRGIFLPLYLHGTLKEMAVRLAKRKPKDAKPLEESPFVRSVMRNGPKKSGATD